VKIQAVIKGIHGYIPKYILSNFKLEKIINTTNEWIKSRTGVEERRVLKNKNQGSSFMGTKAVIGLLKKTKTKVKDIDLIICATITPDLIFPSTASIISNKIKAINAFGYDINSACSGFLFAMITGSQFIETKKYKKIIIIGVDKMSNIIDYKDRSTCVIFGDGAGAVLLEANKNNFGIIDSILKIDGKGKKYLYQKAGGSANPTSYKTILNKEHYVYQYGKIIFKAAVNSLIKIINEIIKKNKINKNNINFFILHQANKRIIETVSKKISIKKRKTIITIDKFGNTTNATIPICLWKYEKKLKKNDKIILSVFGAGFSWGSVYIKWGY
jgi:3-oxoacyl-[acyl-carrier-protein] synthase-3